LNPRRALVTTLVLATLLPGRRAGAEAELSVRLPLGLHVGGSGVRFESGLRSDLLFILERDEPDVPPADGRSRLAVGPSVDLRTVGLSRADGALGVQVWWFTGMNIYTGVGVGAAAGTALLGEGPGRGYVQASLSTQPIRLGGSGEGLSYVLASGLSIQGRRWTGGAYELSAAVELGGLLLHFFFGLMSARGG
jgi:hypothetical protein